MAKRLDCQSFQIGWNTYPKQHSRLQIKLVSDWYRTECGSDKATSLKILTNQSFDRMKILKQFMNVFLERLNLLKNGPQDIFMNLYRKHLYGSNEYLTAEINGKKIDQIKIIDVLPTGQINVEISGLQKIFSFGDIRFFLSD